MSVSIDCYRVRIGCFKSNHRSYQRTKHTKKSNNHDNNQMTSAGLKLILVLLVFLSIRQHDSIRNGKPIKSKLQYPHLICSIFQETRGQKQVADGSPVNVAGVLEHVHWQQLEVAHHSSTSIFRKKSCVLLTKSTMIEDYNFLARYQHGNRRSTGHKLCHWNKGGPFLHNRVNEIEQTIEEYKPHILGVSEANFHRHHNLDDVQIENYTLYLAKTLENPDLNISRVAVYVHKDVTVKVRTDLINDSFSYLARSGSKKTEEISCIQCIQRLEVYESTK